jgi:hypothetical protein
MIYAPPLSTLRAGSTNFALERSSEQWTKIWQTQGTASRRSIGALLGLVAAVLPRSEAWPATVHITI